MRERVRRNVKKLFGETKRDKGCVGRIRRTSKLAGHKEVDIKKVAIVAIRLLFLIGTVTFTLETFIKLCTGTLVDTIISIVLAFSCIMGFSILRVDYN